MLPGHKEEAHMDTRRKHTSNYKICCEISSSLPEIQKGLKPGRSQDEQTACPNWRYPISESQIPRHNIIVLSREKREHNMFCPDLINPRPMAKTWQDFKVSSSDRYRYSNAYWPNTLRWPPFGENGFHVARSKIRLRHLVT
jgi:hypothetical protein